MSETTANEPMGQPVAAHQQHLLMRVRIVAAFAAFVLLCFLWVANCSGPRPSWSHLQVQPPSSSSQGYQVSLAVTNAGWGHGQVNVIVRLASKANGQTYQQDQTVTLNAGETTNVSLQVSAPPGQYTPEVELQYPPR